MVDLVLFFTQDVSLQVWDQTGLFDREVALYRELRDEGHQISFVTYGDKREQTYSEKLPGIKIIHNRWNLPPAWYRLSLKLSNMEGSIYKSNQVAGADVALASARRSGKPFVARCGYLPSLLAARQNGSDSEEATAARKLESHVFKHADRVIVTTPSIRDTVLDEYNLKPERVEIIPNYVETDRFRPLQRAKRDHLRIGFVGRLHPEKNLTNLITAISGLNVDLDLVGSGHLLAELETLAEAVHASVRFLGSLPNHRLPEFLNTCDLFVLPSPYEGHPKALLEAMACGLPVIGSRVGGIKELITDGQNGLLCEPDAPGIRMAIQRAMADEDLRKHLGENACRFVNEKFSLEHIVNLEMAMLESVST